MEVILIVRWQLSINYGIFNAKRLLIIKIYRAILKKTNQIYLVKVLKKYLIYIGLLKENPNKTFF